ncbi:MAG: hypothetical protein HY689_16435 [Chloroflexi bacterium]|nr:hypothetical protein [Chloroflexota bacterium]
MTMEAKRQSEQVSGIPNVTYDLMAVLTNKLEGIAAMEEYKLDARESGDQEAAGIFEQLEQRAREDVQKLKTLLARRLAA